MTMDTEELLREMVNIYSPSGEERELANFLQTEMTDLGFRTTRDDVGNLIGRIGEGEKRVLLLGHLDTVEGEIPVREEDGRLYGRGSVDAKGPLANFIGTAGQFEGFEDLEITVAGVVEEETSSKGAYEIVDALSPDYVVVGEPSSWDGITLGYRGSIRVSYSLQVPKTHRGEGSSLPAEEAVRLYQRLRDLFSSDSSGFYSTDVRLDQIRTENQPFSDSVRMNLDVRTGPDFQEEELEEFLEENQTGPTITTTRHIPPVKSSKRNRLVSSLLSGIRGAGGEPTFKLKTGTADMNILAERWEAPMVAYGPGDSSLDHTPNEHLRLKELSLAGEVLSGALAKLGELAGKP